MQSSIFLESQRCSPTWNLAWKNRPRAWKWTSWKPHRPRPPSLHRQNLRSPIHQLQSQSRNHQNRSQSRSLIQFPSRQNQQPSPIQNQHPDRRFKNHRPHRARRPRLPQSPPQAQSAPRQERRAARPAGRGISTIQSPLTLRKAARPKSAAPSFSPSPSRHRAAPRASAFQKAAAIRGSTALRRRPSSAGDSSPRCATACPLPRASPSPSASSCRGDSGQGGFER